MLPAGQSVVELLAELAYVGMALRGVERHRLEDRSPDRVIKLRPQFGRPCGTFPGQHFISDDSERIRIARGAGVPLKLLGGHVSHAAGDFGLRAGESRVLNAGDSE